MKDYFKDKKILITGGLGFLGSNIAHQLVEYGANVTLLDALLPLYGGNRFNIHGIEDKVEVIIGDIRDFRLIEKTVEGKDIIYNLAGQVSYTDSIEIPFEDIDINCKGHMIVLDACRHRNPHATIVFSSSRMVLGKILYTPVDEKHPTEPLSIYGIHKLTGEKYYLAYHKTYGLKTVILRITNPYGIRQQMKHDKYSLVGWFLRQAMERKTIQIFGDGKQLRDYIYVEDIINAFLTASISDKAVGNIYNAGFGKSHQFSDMVKTVLKVVGQGKLEYVPWPENYEKIETGSFKMSLEKAKSDLGWSPKIELEDGIKKMYEFYKKFKHYYW
ncbi:MAG: NAD-dependent epimerase/dehydratase family protein [Candidatus Scalinduaceae bacterium]